MKPSKSPSSRAIQVGLRSVHIAAMGLLLGTVASSGTTEQLRTFTLATTASGFLLLVVATRSGCLALSQGAGWGLFAKLGLLGLAGVFPSSRLEFFVAATLLASVSSHMPASWRHRTLPALLLRRGHHGSGTDPGPNEPR
jgi:hypothetical protein